MLPSISNKNVTYLCASRPKGYVCSAACMQVRELLKILSKDGWIRKAQKGSHLQLIHPVKRGKVTLPMHSGDIPKGTLNAILKQAGLKPGYGTIENE